MRPFRPSMPMLGISCIRKCGCDIVHEVRFWLVASQRPFLVPMATTTVPLALIGTSDHPTWRGRNAVLADFRYRAAASTSSISASSRER